jgi:hypothetical protein
MADKDKLAKYRTEIQQVSSSHYSSQIIAAPLKASVIPGTWTGQGRIGIPKACAWCGPILESTSLSGHDLHMHIEGASSRFPYSRISFALCAFLSRWLFIRNMPGSQDVASFSPTSYSYKSPYSPSPSISSSHNTLSYLSFLSKAFQHTLSPFVIPRILTCCPSVP